MGDYPLMALCARPAVDGLQLNLWIPDGSGCNELGDPLGDHTRGLFVVMDDVPRRRTGSVHLPPHALGSTTVGKAVTLAGRDAFQTDRKRRKQQRVVQVRYVRLSAEGFYEPRPYDPVIDHIAVLGQSASRSRRRLRDRCVLRVRFGKPGRDCAVPQKPEEVVTWHQRARVEQTHEPFGHRGLPRPGRSSDHDDETHERQGAPTSSPSGYCRDGRGHPHMPQMARWCR